MTTVARVRKCCLLSCACACIYVYLYTSAVFSQKRTIWTWWLLDRFIASYEDGRKVYFLLGLLAKEHGSCLRGGVL
jgi:hypothetical protein